MRIIKAFIVITLIYSGCRPKTDHSLVGHYEGYFEYRNKKLSATMDFENHTGTLRAFLSIPDNLQLNKPLIIDVNDPPLLSLKILDDTLTSIRAFVIKDHIDGRLNGAIPAFIHLRKMENYSPPSKTYSTENITLNNNGVKLSANLYLPKTNLPKAAIIIVAGSGNHTKEEYNGAADLFASRGIATLTFDKRNVTSLPGVNLNHVNSDIVLFKDLIGDVESAFYFLKNNKQINKSKIGLIGFSLGAVEVPVVAANHPDVAFVMAISGNATTDKEFVINQGLNLYRENGYDSETITKADALYNDLFAYAKTRLNQQQLQAKLHRAYLEKWGQLCFPPVVPNEDELKYLLTWNNFEFDPGDYWKKINVPSLVIYGEKDKYIPVKRSIEILKKIFEKKQALLTLKEYSNADHTIRVLPDTANFEFPKYADGYINDVVSWLLKQTYK